MSAVPQQQEQQQQQRRMAFDRDAAGYYHGRPPYPQRVYDLLADRYGLAPGCRVLEVGPGSGTATDELLARGAHVTAVEPGASLAELLRERHRADPLTVVNADFEDAELSGESFDLAVAATSFHWVDPAVGVPKVASLLRPGGALVVWWTIFGDPQAAHTQFRQSIDPLCARYLRPAPKPESVMQWRERLHGGGLFDPVAVELLRWSQRLTAASAQALWATFPNVVELSPADREAFLAALGAAVDRLGGQVDDPRLTIVYHTRRSQNG